LAYAGPCSIQLLDNRPIFGGIVWNIHYSDLDNMNSIKFEYSVSTAIHEIIHGLGFISALYPYYIDHNTMKSYDNVTYYDDLKRMVLNTPRLTNISRNYFNCYNANGAVVNNLFNKNRWKMKVHQQHKNHILKGQYFLMK